MRKAHRRQYTSRIIKASALLADTKALLAAWDLNKSTAQNLEQIRQQNTLGKTSRMRLEDVLTIFRQRYLDDPDIVTMLVVLTQGHAPAQWIDPLLYFFSAQNDCTLHDFVTQVLYERKRAGYLDLPTLVVQNALRSWVAEAKTASPWNEETIERVAQGILATLRDFGVLEGKVNKQISPIYLPLESFALIAFWLMMRVQSGMRVLHSDEWRLFFLEVPGVERLFIEAHQEKLLTYYAAGSVVRLEFPVTTAKEYAHGLLERTR